MWQLLYSLLLYILSPVIWLYFAFRALKAREYREGWAQRLGLVSRKIRPGAVVIHCASVGETRAAAPLVKKFCDSYLSQDIVVTTTTPTGKKAVKELFGDKVIHQYLPVDWFGSSRRFLKAVQPRLLILMETELWYNLLCHAQKQRVPVLLANARMSDQSRDKYLKYTGFSNALFSRINAIGAQFESDKNNFVALGVKEEKIQTLGSIKFDLRLTNEQRSAQKSLRALWAPNRPVWIAASIHPAEFKTIINCHLNLLKQIPDLLLIGVPRHPEKFDAFEQAGRDARLNLRKRSGLKADEQQLAADCQLVVGDTMGEMLLLCGVSQVAYVGGSLIERGGHNPLEPLVAGNAVVMGQHVYNFADICHSLQESQLLDIVKSGEALSDAILRLFSDPQMLSRRSEAGLAFMRANAGCVDNLMKMARQLSPPQE